MLCHELGLGLNFHHESSTSIHGIWTFMNFHRAFSSLNRSNKNGVNSPINCRPASKRWKNIKFGLGPWNFKVFWCKWNFMLWNFIKISSKLTRTSKLAVHLLLWTLWTFMNFHMNFHMSWKQAETDESYVMKVWFQIIGYERSWWKFMPWIVISEIYWQKVLLSELWG